MTKKSTIKGGTMNPLEPPHQLAIVSGRMRRVGFPVMLRPITLHRTLRIRHRTSLQGRALVGFW